MLLVLVMLVMLVIMTVRVMRVIALTFVLAYVVIMFCYGDIGNGRSMLLLKLNTDNSGSQHQQ